MWKDKCGLFGIYTQKEEDLFHLMYLGLSALQHRGQESAGIAATDGNSMYLQKGVGLVSEALHDNEIGQRKEMAAIGHVRYSTYGASVLDNAQPLVAKYSGGVIAVAHNGNIVNADTLRERLEYAGSIFQSATDTEIIIHLLARLPGKTVEDALMSILKELKGAYSLLILTTEKLIAIRDPWGFRPLSIGRLDDKILIASESCAFDIMGAKPVREIEPGEMVIIDKEGEKSIRFAKSKEHFCTFEFVYFARPDSRLYGRDVYKVRKSLGEELAREKSIEADVVIPVPDSGTPAALGYAQASGIPFDFGIIRNRYVGRTFIQPTQFTRSLGVRIKLNPLPDIVKDKRVIIVDDSIVRGTTSRMIVKMLRDAGAREVHFRISSPPVKFPCFYGIDTPDREKLIASSSNPTDIAKFLGADSVEYLSIDGMVKAIGLPEDKVCLACFNGKYPVLE